MTGSNLIGAFLLALSALATLAGARAEAPWVFLAEIRGTINPASASYLETAIHRAEADRASALIVELDTPGGLLSSVRQMAQLIDDSRVPVVVYVSPAGAAATSAGALLMLASHVAAMAPGTNIGAAHPVGPQGEDIKGAMGEKAVNDTAAFARGLAEIRGRSRELAEAVVSKSQSFTAEEALKKNLIEIVAPERSDLLKQLNDRQVRLKTGERTLNTLGSVVKPIEMTWGQKTLQILAHPNIAGILMTLGMLLIYVELSNPGITIAGFLGAICLLIALMALQLLPIRAGGLALLLFGMALLIAEPFVVSHGAFAAGGVLSFILGLLWMVDPSSTDLRVTASVWVPAALGLGGVVALIAIAAGRTHALTKRTFARIGGDAVSGLSGYTGHVESISSDGRSGKVVIRGEVWDFVADKPTRVGAPIRAISARGMKIRIEEIPS